MRPSTNLIGALLAAGSTRTSGDLKFNFYIPCAISLASEVFIAQLKS